MITFPNPHEDSRLFDRLQIICPLQRDGKFLVNNAAAPTAQSYLHPLPNPEDLGLRYYDTHNVWGSFHNHWEAEVRVLESGTPPNELLPQPQIEPALAFVHPVSGFTRIQPQDARMSPLDLDALPADDERPAQFLQRLNAAIGATGLVVWKLIWQESQPQRIRIFNDSAAIWATSALWDADNMQLVAAQVVSSSQQLLKAIWGSLVTNSRKTVTIQEVGTPNGGPVTSARKGYLRISGHLTAANAVGHLWTLEHPLSGNPAEQPGGICYVVAITGEDLTAKFIQRLDLAIPWPVQPEWGETLLNAGLAAGLVIWLEQAGPTDAGTEYAAGLRVSKDVWNWQAVIQTALEQGQIALN